MLIGVRFTRDELPHHRKSGVRAQEKHGALRSRAFEGGEERWSGAGELWSLSHVSLQDTDGERWAAAGSAGRTSMASDFPSALPRYPGRRPSYVSVGRLR